MKSGPESTLKYNAKLLANPQHVGVAFSPLKGKKRGSSEEEKPEGLNLAR